jgi:hypothetical protein
MKRLSFLFQFVFITPLITAIHLLASVVLWYRRPCSLLVRNVGVEPLPASLDSEEHVLRDISNFVAAGAPNSGTNYSSVIDVSEQYLRVELKRRDNTRAVEILSRSFVAEESDLQVIQTLVACPTWTNAQFVFSSNPDFDTTIFGIFSLLRSSPSLSTLDIALDHSYHRLLPTLLCENAFLETLTLNPTLFHYGEPCYCTCMHPLNHSHNCASSECLQELFQVFIPGSSGRQAANTHLTTLKLKPPVYCNLEHNMKALSRMLRVNTTLKHVEVVFGGVNPRIVWEVRSSKPVHCTHVKVCTQEILEAMIGNELKTNASLLSLVVGAWTLRRAGGGWQMSYGGPCQARKVQTRGESPRLLLK